MDKTLLKGLSVLEAVVEQGTQPTTIQDLALRVGLTCSNTQRTLQTLAHAGYAVRDESTGAYWTTLKLFELGSKQLAALDVRRFAAQPMRRLADTTLETVQLSTLDRGAVLYIDKIDSPQPVHAYSAIGSSVPAWCVATGKAILAFQPPEYWTRHLPEAIGQSGASAPDIDLLRVEFARIRRDGYAVNPGEWREGGGGVAAPIFDGMGVTLAAIGISGALERLGEAQVKALAPKVLEAGREISRAMGYRGLYNEA
ncbi:IclR family transcriptional regulator [Paraburkholderia fungorum]|uniref:IclR family transcriptional regulator n=1 Tax=Paraburkholderia fungorum TaxID=134537 RepID=UPI0038B7D07E